MKTAARHLRFRQRVELERRILSEVNSKIEGKPLSGVTEPTVNRWMAEVKSCVDGDRVNRISEVILEIARRAEVDADCSRDVFSGEDLLPQNSIEDLMFSLQELLEIREASSN
jgi:hypothetical protein